ncbi:quinone oxidoreductase family protein [Brevibacillus porteri]|uniref:Quinone oxidoreductase n=1 Tax=Brevibacillus porteri TaxID=2126350 RepID=A0ABX5FWP9_9BACL|nr:NADPH:quinone oxidoreductase family protein [Brevibacillus porteri]MED1801011.1 NADPH:quinone oxidoreductase family protein [Brevibacillus porteri]MED2130397.1 NADPH:quinone oxidoreductase family protein [Brevibacillus porteri]MED2742954.1 NADPH:quinone oxidoreductase family protein [Brevibacillus porteri]MED2812637.1 NADPH:quinone oxidoreductase family protein [Brevibacillus porteri]MED2895389.1 NADPH:quinone oxidoreductase family protein [Brevibacillus porteri]
MKAILVTELGGPETMKYTEVEMPTMSPTQVLIRVEMTSVNFADIKSRYGKKGAAKLPFIPGLDATGVIEQVGAEVQSLKVGQRVIAFPANGSYAEYIVADESLTFALPDHIRTETAAACPVVSFTSYQLLAKVARIAKGETVLIHAAAGGIGTTAIQLAKLLGAGRVIGTVGNEAKAELALSAGADHVICNDREDFVEKVRELTDGAGADVILDSISGTVSERSLECLAWYGRLVHFGNASGEIGQIKTIDLHASCRSVLGFSFGTTRKLRPNLLQDTAKQVLEYLANGQLDIKIGKHFALEDAASAHAWVESRASTGKVLLDVRS